MSVFKYGNYSKGMFIFVVVVMAMFASEIVMPMYLQGPMGFSAKVAGMIFITRGITEWCHESCDGAYL